jgi:hypothetical protein
MGEWIYGSKFSWPRQQFGVSGQFHAPAVLPRGKSPRYPLYRRVDGPQSRSGRCEKEKNVEPTGTRNPTPVASRYTAWVIPTPLLKLFLGLLEDIIFWNVKPRTRKIFADFSEERAIHILRTPCTKPYNLVCMRLYIAVLQYSLYLQVVTGVSKAELAVSIFRETSVIA